MFLRSKLTSAAAVTAAPTLHRLLKLTLNRCYSTSGAAQPQLIEPDFYENNERSHRDRLGPALMAEEEVAVVGRGVQWVFIGSPSSKKHIFAEMLSKLLEVPHISMASLVRQELSPRSSLYKQIADAVNNGKLVPEEIIFGLLSKRLEDGYYRGESGFILDGIPRTRMQAEILDQLAEIDLVLNFKCTKDLFLNDQGEGSWKEKLRAYTDQIKELEDYYGNQRKLLNFRVGNAPAETWRGLLTILHLQHISAVQSSQKLTTGNRVNHELLHSS